MAAKQTVANLALGSKVAALRRAGKEEEARTAYEAENSTAKRIAKDEAGEAAKSAMRDFAHTGVRQNKLMHDEDRLFYGIHPADGIHTPGAVPGSFPEAEPDTSIPRQVTIHFWDSVTKKRSKPHNIHGAEIRWAELDNPPASIEALIHSDFDTASPFTLTFDESGAIPQSGMAFKNASHSCHVRYGRHVGG